MNSIYIIEYDNGELYEDHKHWISDNYFSNIEEAEVFLYSKGFEDNDLTHTEGEYVFMRFEENEWYEYTYAQIKELKLHK